LQAALCSLCCFSAQSQAPPASLVRVGHMFRSKVVESGGPVLVRHLGRAQDNAALNVAMRHRRQCHQDVTQKRPRIGSPLVIEPSPLNSSIRASGPRREQSGPLAVPAHNLRQPWRNCSTGHIMLKRRAMYRDTGATLWLYQDDRAVRGWSYCSVAHGCGCRLRQVCRGWQLVPDHAEDIRSGISLAGCARLGVGFDLRTRWRTRYSCVVTLQSAVIESARSIESTRRFSLGHLRRTKSIGRHNQPFCAVMSCPSLRQSACVPDGVSYVVRCSGALVLQHGSKAHGVRTQTSHRCGVLTMTCQFVKLSSTRASVKLKGAHQLVHA
jgi:hypothetical protein